MTPDCSFAVQSARCAENVLIDKLGGNIEGLNERGFDQFTSWLENYQFRRTKTSGVAELRSPFGLHCVQAVFLRSAQPSALYVFKSGATLVPRCALGWYGSGPLALRPCSILPLHGGELLGRRRVALPRECLPVRMERRLLPSCVKQQARDGEYASYFMNRSESWGRNDAWGFHHVEGLESHTEGRLPARS